VWLLLVALAGCGGGGARVSAPVAPPGPPRIADAEHYGSFSAMCDFSHRAPDDPIVHPSDAGMSHLHDFFGNASTNSVSTLVSLKSSATTCRSPSDRSAYWVPTLSVDNVPAPPVGSAAYYRTAPGVDARVVQAPPIGLQMISHQATWRCGHAPESATVPRQCAPQAPLRLTVTFPDCWDGEHLSSSDHRSHVASSVAGVCPASHPVPITQLVFEVRYNVSGSHVLSLSSGGLGTAHADAIVVWDRDHLRREVSACVQRLQVCDLTWNTELQPGY
jgi:hypothetical protein